MVLHEAAKYTILPVPRNMLNEELTGLYGNTVLEDMRKTLELYRIYEKGAQFVTEGAHGDYSPAQHVFMKSRSLIDKEVRFLFGRKPDFHVSVVPSSGSDLSDQDKDANTVLQEYVDKVLQDNQIAKALIKAAKDCFIGKRVACILNFDNEDGGVGVRFAPSLEFIFETDTDDENSLTKLVVFYTVKDSPSRTEQEIYKKKYWMQGGFCWVEEALYDGTGRIKEELIAARATLFEFIPAVVILNDGLTGDLIGVSEVDLLSEGESWFSRLSNADMDAMRKGMNPVKWARDMDPNSTKGLSSAAGSFWDLQTDQNSAEGATGEVGVLETSMGYSTSLETTLKRINSMMHEIVSVPDISEMQAKVSSGKELKAIYWDLIMRCDEKMVSWRPALEFIVRTLIIGGRLYPKAAAKHTDQTLPDSVFEVKVDNQYPLPEDEVEAKELDLMEVSSSVMSKKAYMKKWRGLTDDEADEELKQIAAEREQLEDSFTMPGAFSSTSPTQTSEQDDAIE